MNDNKAIGCYREGEEKVLIDSLSFLARQVDPRNELESFQRIISVGGFPSLASLEGLKINKLLDLRNSDEFLSFRRFHNYATELSDKQLQEELSHQASRIRAVVGGAVGSMVWKLFIFGFQALGNLPLAADYGLSATPWLADKLISKKGHAVFLHRDYRSIFE